MSNGCRIRQGSVKFKSGLRELPHPGLQWEGSALGGAVSLINEIAEYDYPMDAIAIVVHYADRSALTYLNRSDDCVTAYELIPEFVKENLKLVVMKRFMESVSDA